MMIAEKLRAARLLVGLTQNEFAKLANLSTATINRMEKVGGVIGMRAPTIRKAEETLEALGVVLTEDGVRLKPKQD